MSYNVSFDRKLPSEDKIEKQRKELQVFLNCVKHNPEAFEKLCDLGIVSGHELDSECCAPVEKKVLLKVGLDFVKLLLSGEQKINGKMGHWSCGFMGSRWCDLKASDYGLDYVRCAFYSKNFYEGEWKHTEPFVIQITCEKTK